MAEDRQCGGFGIYIHWPFCLSKCPYCDFNSHVSASVDVGAWQTAFLAELDRAAQHLSGRVVDSIFFGGGTPSLMPPKLVSAIVGKVNDIWTVADELEVTLEANPTSVEADRFADFHAAGVNRASVGVQALNDPDLQRLGRLHSVKEAMQALEIARNTFDRVSFDLIYARQNQDVSSWQSELSVALALNPDHLSLYQLTIEPETAFGRLHDAGKLSGLPIDGQSADMFAATQEMTARAGLPAYEISNHATPGNQSRHNMIYWRYGDYLGLGPGAHGRLILKGKKFATESFKAPNDWLAAVSNGTGYSDVSELDPENQAVEYLMMSLRLTEGTSSSRYAAMSGTPLKPHKIRYLCDLNLINVNGDRLQATARGKIVLNSVLQELLSD